MRSVVGSMSGRGIGCFIVRFREALAAVVTIDVIAPFERQIDQRMAEGIGTAIAADVFGRVVNNFNFAGFRGHRSS